MLLRCCPQNYRLPLGGNATASHPVLSDHPPKTAGEGSRREAANPAPRSPPAEAHTGLTAPEWGRAALPIQAARGGPGPAPLVRAQAPPGARGGGLPARGRRLHALPGRCSLPAPLGSGPRLEARRVAGEDSGAPSAALLGGHTRRVRDSDIR